jgi:hypothetical protein
MGRIVFRPIFFAHFAAAITSIPAWRHPDGLTQLIFQVKTTKGNRDENPF